MAKLSDTVYEKLKPVVMDAKEGDFFSVRKSASQLGVSYTPVREALLRLHKEGLLNLIPNVGFFVTHMDMRTIVDIHQSRDCVERYVLPQVVEKMTTADIAALRVLVTEQHRALERGDHVTYAARDEAFHNAIIDLLGNRKLSDFYSTVRSQYQVGNNKIAVSYSELPIQEHERFLQKVETGDFPGALEVYYAHTAAALNRMKEGYVRIG